MSTVRNPREKKRLSYKKDHVVRGGENDKAFRKNWPLKRARINRAYRRKVSQVFAAPDVIDADEALSAARSMTRSKVRKWGAVSLGESVAKGQEERIRRHGARKACLQIRRSMLSPSPEPAGKSSMKTDTLLT